MKSVYAGPERRSRTVPVAVERREHDHTRLISQFNCLDIVYTPEEEEFLKAMETYKARYRRPFPTWREALAVLKSLGYEKKS